MITVLLVRQTRKGNAVRGKIDFPFEVLDKASRSYVEQQMTFDTLENADFLIPAGTYPLRLTWSPRFRKEMPLIDEVPEREGIRIHMGTRPEHSAGCVLVSAEALDYIKTLFNQRKKWYSENELRIQIVDRLETGRS